MSTAASPAPSEVESKRGEVTYRFCQDWSVLLPLVDLPRELLMRSTAQTSFTLKKTARPHNSFSYARHATPPSFLITLAPTAINSAPTLRKLLVSRLMLQMIQLCVMSLLCCLGFVQCAEIKSGAEAVENQHWRSLICRTCQAKKGAMETYPNHFSAAKASC